MNTASMRLEILRLVNKKEGEMSWYQLGRALSHDEFLPMIDQLGSVLKSLREEGLLTSEGDGPYPVYKTTEQGRQELSATKVAA